MKHVSVILTTYNGEDTLKETIASIQHQAGINEEFELEIIAIDDCSTDGTVDLLKKLGVNPISTKENSGGPNKGRNIGLKTCSGDYICIVDQDDLWDKNRIQMMLPFCENYPIVTTGYTIMDSTKNRKTIKLSYNEDGFIVYEKNQNFISKLTKSTKGQCWYLGAIMFKNELKNILFEEKYGMVDFDWSLRLFYNRTSLEICKSSYTRRVSAHNLSLNETYRENDFYHSLQIIEKYRQEFPQEVALSCLKIHGSRARYYYLSGDMKKARSYFLKSDYSWKTILYYLTTFMGHSFVKSRFNVFG